MLTLNATPNKKLIIVGDSLTEGYGVSREQAYPALLQQKLTANKMAWTVVNSGISGSTSSSAISRVEWALKQKPDLILLALGANDGLRGLKPSDLYNNLKEAITACQRAKVKIVLAGIKVPPNYGESYSRSFEAVYPRLAKINHVPLIPFLLEGVAGVSTLNQEDGIHPNAKGHVIIAENIFKSLAPHL